MSTCRLEFQSVIVDLNGDHAPFSPVVADFNGDNQSDIAFIVGFYPGHVKVLFGSSNGTFTPPITIYEGDSYHSLSADDFDNNEYIDLIVFYSFGKTLTMLPGNGDGTFAPPIVLMLNSTITHDSIVIGHFNEDNSLDMAIADTVTEIFDVFFGNGNGSFAAETNNSIKIENSDKLMGVSDFNNDGYSDIVVTNFYPNSVVIYLGYGNGTFKRQKRMFIGPSFKPQAIVVDDLNGDTRLDIAVSYELANAVSILFGYGNGTFRIKKNIVTRKKSGNSWLISLSDLNEDGLLDIILSCSNPYSIDVLVAHDHENFEVQEIFSIESDRNTYFNPSVGDFNGDGHQDMVAEGEVDGTMNIFLNTCNCCVSIPVITKDGNDH